MNAPSSFGPPRTILLAVAVALMSAVLLGSATSASAAPRNNDFGDAAALRVGKDVKGNINGAAKQRGEPRHADSLATHSVWYRFRSKRKVSVLLGTCSSSFDTVVAVYSGRRLADSGRWITTTMAAVEPAPEAASASPPGPE